MHLATMLLGVTAALVLAEGVPAARELQDPLPLSAPGLVSPEISKEVKPKYTRKAQEAGIQGIVEMEAVVLPDGKVGHVRVVKSLDSVHGLDEEAVKALKKWRFKPGTRSGKRVPVLVTVEMTFTLKKRGQATGAPASGKAPATLES